MINIAMICNECFDDIENRKINGTEEIDLLTPTPGVIVLNIYAYQSYSSVKNIWSTIQVTFKL